MKHGNHRRTARPHGSSRSTAPAIRKAVEKSATSSPCSRADRRNSRSRRTFRNGCSLVFSPGWEADRNGGTAGLCQPVERDLFDCHMGCFWPAQVPDQLNHAPDWTSKCAAAQKDWRKIDLIFPDKK